ncbi:MAG: hypothetical protein KKF62_04850 [Bacteroidetes bacterium]|nr:hypothetical protein [Bacteroidota bacterium]MBU1114762.1 hypothetical protein [Bacteroidota bacterium]MBU1797785.1 hypothetical protein [Bacteroidota bacterium]
MMENKSKLQLALKLAVITIFIFSGLIKSQNENDAVRLAVPGIISSARALGMGNSYQTRSGDYSALFFNPAGLALSKKSQLTGSFYHRSYGNTSDFFGEENASDNSSTKFSQLGYLYKAPTTRGSLVYGFGYQKDKDFTSSLNFNGFNPNRNSMIQDLTNRNDDVPYLLGLSYPLWDANDNYIKDETIIDGQLNQSGTTLEDGGINRYSVGAGIEFAKNVYFGGSLNYLSGTYSNNREYYEDDFNRVYTQPTDINDPNTKNFQTFYFNDAISWDINAWEFRFGFIMDWMDFIQVGASTKLPTTFVIRENYYLKAYSKFNDNYFIDLNPSESLINYEITTPFEFSLGGSINLHIININAQATFIDYSQMEFSGDIEQSIIKDNNRVINDNFRAALNYNLGAELRVPNTGICARAGLMYYESPYKDDPTSFDRVYLNAGAGIEVNESIKFDLAYSYGFWDTYSDNYGSDLSRVSQKVDSHTFMLTTTIMY